MENNNYQDLTSKNPKRKGASLIITFFIMIIILAVVLSVSIILYSQVKVIRNIGSSVVSYYIGESGIEKVLYYDRQVLPNGGQTCTSSAECITMPYIACSNGICTIAPYYTKTCNSDSDCLNNPYRTCSNGFCALTSFNSETCVSNTNCTHDPYRTCVAGYCSRTYWPRGLCSMFDITKNPNNYCKSDDNNGADNIFCNNSSPNTFTGTCSYDNCIDCTISFNTVFDANTGKSYTTTATIDRSGKDFSIESLGKYGETQRKIYTLAAESNEETPPPAPAPSPGPLNIPPEISSAPEILNAKATFSPNWKITVSAGIFDPDGIDKNTAIASIYELSSQGGQRLGLVVQLELESSGDNTYSKVWNGALNGTYYSVDIAVLDLLGNLGEVIDIPNVYQ